MLNKNEALDMMKGSMFTIALEGREGLREYLHALAVLQFVDDIKKVLKDYAEGTCVECDQRKKMAVRLLDELGYLDEWEKKKLMEI